MRKAFACWGILALGTASGASAGLLDHLSTNDAARVERGEQVLVTEAVADHPWPRARIYQRSDAAPDELMAVFFDYDNAADYVPNCAMSKIAREVDPRTFEVDYVVNVPIFPDEAYTARNQLSEGPGKRMAIDWQVLKATSIESSVGSLVVEPYGNGTLLCYTNLVKPSSKAACLLKGIAIRQMGDTVNAILEQTDRKKQTDAASLRRQITRLQAALASES